MTVTLPFMANRLLTDLTDSDFEHHQKQCAQSTDPSLYPHSTSLASQVVIFDAKDILAPLRGSPTERQAVMDEFHRALLTGPGVFVIRNMIPRDVIDRAEVVTGRLNQVASGPRGNRSRRTFGYSEKHAKCDAESFAEYYGNEVLAAVCEAWLGPGYQITATTNATFKGGEQQEIHRDYHVSHQSLDRIRRFPTITQVASQFLTLQSAIAHTDMPLETGPTRFMPYSQLFEKGYIAVRDPRYIEFVKPRMVQLELQKGDAVFFNPATFHQPGENVTDNERVANLLQVSSAFGRSMESCDRLGMTKSVWPVFKRWHEELKNETGSSGSEKGRHQLQLDALIAATCSDYGYPKIFDAVPGGPETQADLVNKALAESMEDDAVYAMLEEYQTWHLP